MEYIPEGKTVRAKKPKCRVSTLFHPNARKNIIPARRKVPTVCAEDCVTRPSRRAGLLFRHSSGTQEDLAEGWLVSVSCVGANPI